MKSQLSLFGFPKYRAMIVDLKFDEPLRYWGVRVEIQLRRERSRELGFRWLGDSLFILCSESVVSCSLIPALLALGGIVHLMATFNVICRYRKGESGVTTCPHPPPTQTEVRLPLELGHETSYSCP